MEFRIRSKKLKRKFIYGDLRENKKSTTLVVFLSGLSGGKDFSLFKHASSEFFKNGFSTIRFNFCNDGKDRHPRIDALKLENISFSVYMTELKNLLHLLNKKYSSIVLVGHSFGAVISILFLSKYKRYAEKTTLILWDPSILPWKKEWMEEDFVLDIHKKLYHTRNGDETINKTFYKECIRIENTANILQSLNKKVCIIAAEGSADKDANKYFAKTRKKKISKLLILRGTDHYFKGGKPQKELFEETINFLKV